MKKTLISLLLVFGMVSTSQPITSHAAQSNIEKRPIEINVNGTFISLDVQPVIDNNHLFLPIRSLSSLGISYSWSPSAKVATLKNKNGEYIKITVGSKTAYKADQPIKMEQAAKNNDGRVLVPIRFVSEALSYHVQYEQIRNMVFVTSKDYKLNMETIYGDDLLTARRAAISLPITTDFIPFGSPGFNNEYSFPIGRADMYYFMDGFYWTFVEIKDGKAIAIGQFDGNDRSRTTGKVPSNMIFDTDPTMDPYRKGNVLFYEISDGRTTTTATAAYNDENGKRVELITKINVYSDIIQPLPDHR